MMRRKGYHLIGLSHRFETMWIWRTYACSAPGTERKLFRREKWRHRRWEKADDPRGHYKGYHWFVGGKIFAYRKIMNKGVTVNTYREIK